MRAAIYKSTGNASDVLELVDIERPAPNDNQVLVKLHASGINPTDTKTRAGIFPIQNEWERIVPHHDGAGIIEEAGKNVSQERIGERVWLHSAQLAGTDGTAAEYIVVDAEKAISLPDNIDFEAGATFGVPLLTAYQGVMLNGPIEGKTILIQGGAGAVGNYAIQIACEKGATVITTVSGQAKADAAKSAGAHHVVNYKEEDLAQRIQEITNGIGVDYVLEVNLSANAKLLPRIVKNGGFVAVYGADEFYADFPMVESVIQQIKFGFFIVFMMPPEALANAVNDLTTMLSKDKIKPHLHKVLELENIAEAHDLVDDKTTIGNIVLKI